MCPILQFVMKGVFVCPLFDVLRNSSLPFYCNISISQHEMKIYSFVFVFFVFIAVSIQRFKTVKKFCFPVKGNIDVFFVFVYSPKEGEKELLIGPLCVDRLVLHINYSTIFQPSQTKSKNLCLFFRRIFS